MAWLEDLTYKLKRWIGSSQQEPTVERVSRPSIDSGEMREVLLAVTGLILAADGVPTQDEIERATMFVANHELFKVIDCSALPYRIEAYGRRCADAFSRYEVTDVFDYLQGPPETTEVARFAVSLAQSLTAGIAQPEVTATLVDLCDLLDLDPDKILPSMIE